MAHIIGARRPRMLGPLAVLAVALGFGTEVSAQLRGRPSLADSFSYRTATFSPVSGPAGTTVSVRWQYLPAITPMRLGVGAQRVGFEVLSEVLSDERGEFTDTITIPEWAQTDRPVMLVVFDFYFNPLAISSGFQVTDANGVILRTGELKEPSGKCAVLEGEGGAIYYLTGNSGDFNPGDRVLLQATVTDPAVCGRGDRDVALQVIAIRQTNL